MNDIFHPEFSTDPYWWVAAKPTAEGSMPVPEETDVAIIGSGYTGLHAAMTLADQGHRVTVFEAKEFGHGASSRSGGHVSCGYSVGKSSADGKPSPLLKKLGAERFNKLYSEAFESFTYLEDVIEREKINCHFVKGGRFVAAYVPQHLDGLKAKIPLLDRDGLSGCKIISKDQQREEIGSSFFHGGMVIERSGKLHPALYHRGLLEACKRRGVTLCANAPVRDVRPDGSGFRLMAGDVEVRAAEVLLSTNAYSKRPSRWLRRRVIPLSSCIIATEQLDEALIARLIVNDRSINDTKRVINYFRVSPDGKRLLFGGRESFFTDKPRESGRRLHAKMTRIFPELAKVKITHSWSGKVAMTFDHLPHIGVENGIHYAAGCNGSGVAMMSYLGSRIGAKIAGENAPSAFDGLVFPTRPSYTGKTWFMPIVGEYFKTRDKIDRFFS